MCTSVDIVIGGGRGAMYIYIYDYGVRQAACNIMDMEIGRGKRREHVWHTCGKMCSLHVAISYSFDATACVYRIYGKIMHLHARSCVASMSFHDKPCIQSVSLCMVCAGCIDVPAGVYPSGARCYSTWLGQTLCNRRLFCKSVVRNRYISSKQASICGSPRVHSDAASTWW